MPGARARGKKEGTEFLSGSLPVRIPVKTHERQTIWRKENALKEIGLCGRQVQQGGKRRGTMRKTFPSSLRNRPRDKRQKERKGKRIGRHPEPGSEKVSRKKTKEEVIGASKRDVHINEGIHEGGRRTQKETLS